MKRYVREFANDIINGYKNNELMRDDIRNELNGKIECVIGAADDGLITDLEAVEMIVNIANGR